MCTCKKPYTITAIENGKRVSWCGRCGKDLVEIREIHCPKCGKKLMSIRIEGVSDSAPIMAGMVRVEHDCKEKVEQEALL